MLASGATYSAAYKPPSAKEIRARFVREHILYGTGKGRKGRRERKEWLDHMACLMYDLKKIRDDFLAELKTLDVYLIEENGHMYLQPVNPQIESPLRGTTWLMDLVTFFEECG
jgi:hypothetical protein